MLEGGFRYLAVQGEVSNSKLQPSGHFYFSLKDQNAQISAVMFKADVDQLQKLPKDGDQVILKGSLNVYPPSGKYQVVARTLEFAGAGALLLKLEALKAKLKEKGLFDPRHKKPLPKFPEQIGVITSPTGAVIQDIIHVLERRFPGFKLLLYPVKVQGEGAAAEIAAAIDAFNEYKLADVLIVGRGGGSIEDLFAFNEEIVAESIFRSNIPIISAVGHETDTTIADFVADVRAPTPSAAAEMVIFEKASELRFLETKKAQINHWIKQIVSRGKERVLGIARHPLLSSPYALIQSKIQRVDEIKAQIDRQVVVVLKEKNQKLTSLKQRLDSLKPTRKLEFFKKSLIQLSKAFDTSILTNLSKEKKHLERTELLLKALDPRNVLTKGYAIVFSQKSQSVVQSIKCLSENELVTLQFADGKAEAFINSLNSK